jgi:hypothetical protein
MKTVVKVEAIYSKTLVVLGTLAFAVTGYHLFFKHRSKNVALITMWVIFQLLFVLYCAGEFLNRSLIVVWNHKTRTEIWLYMEFSAYVMQTIGHFIFGYHYLIASLEIRAAVRKVEGPNYKWTIFWLCITSIILIYLAETLARQF